VEAGDKEVSAHQTKASPATGGSEHETVWPFWCHEQSHDRPRCATQCAECADDGDVFATEQPKPNCDEPCDGRGRLLYVSLDAEPWAAYEPICAGCPVLRDPECAACLVGEYAHECEYEHPCDYRLEVL
jgi:hypothetical protein